MSVGYKGDSVFNTPSADFIPTLKIKDNSSVVLRFTTPLSEFTGALVHYPKNYEGKTRMYVCLNQRGGTNDCPLCDMGDKQKPQAAAVVLNREPDSEDAVVAVFTFGKMISEQLRGLEEAYGDTLDNYDVKISTKGSMLTKKYTAVVLPKYTYPMSDSDMELATSISLDNFYVLKTRQQILDEVNGVQAESGSLPF